MLLALITWFTTAKKQFRGPEASRTVVIQGRDGGVRTDVVVSNELYTKGQDMQETAALDF